MASKTSKKKSKSKSKSKSTKRKSMAKKSSSRLLTYQKFVAKELRTLRKKHPGLKQTEYMKLAAREWNKYKIDHNMPGGAKTKKSKSGSKTSKKSRSGSKTSKKSSKSKSKKR